jgi:DNA repair exonuclease SbcCD ATPase subunit
MTHQQRAYHYLLQLAPQDRQVTQGNSAQGSGGGGSVRDRELEALETSRRRDFREEASTLAEQMQAAEEARDGLEELARRQEFLNEDMAALVSELQSEDEAVRTAPRIRGFRPSRRAGC